MVKSTNSKILNVTNYRRIPPKNKCTLQIKKNTPQSRLDLDLDQDPPQHLFATAQPSKGQAGLF